MSKQVIFQDDPKISNRKLFRRGMVAGIGWAFGVTIGFVVMSSFLIVFLRSFEGLPIVGSWIADVVEVTIEQLERRSILVGN